MKEKLAKKSNKEKRTVTLKDLKPTKDAKGAAASRLFRIPWR
jgi:hypothetical protein